MKRYDEKWSPQEFFFTSPSAKRISNQWILFYYLMEPAKPAICTCLEVIRKIIVHLTLEHRTYKPFTKAALYPMKPKTSFFSLRKYVSYQVWLSTYECQFKSY